MRFPAYQEYKSSGVAWLGDVPAHWAIKKLKFTASCSVSNVDKKAVEGEEPVRLCNYVDVYYREHIDSSVPFMEATATAAQIEKFALQLGDVMITKDSESPDDIAVPAVVAENLEGVVCGYHLALLRPNVDEVYGTFLGRALSASGVRDHFWSVATGITRYGLTLNDIGTALVTLPPFPEQQAIAAFLDRETARIDALIAKKQRLIELLQEKRAALISHAVTRGLDPTAPLKDSGIEWLGQIPAHWKLVPLKKYLHSLVDYRGATPEKADDGVFLVTTRNIRNGRIDYTNSKEYVSPDDYLETMRRGLPKMGDVLFTMEAPLGEVANVDDESVALAQRIIKMRPKDNVLDGYFLKYWMMSAFFQQDVQTYGTGSTAIGIKASKLGFLRAVIPSLEEQKTIVKYLDASLLRLDNLCTAIENAQLALAEYRASLIAHAVTGKIDVREAIAV